MNNNLELNKYDKKILQRRNAFPLKTKQKQIAVWEELPLNNLFFFPSYGLGGWINCIIDNTAKSNPKLYQQ